ncbi:MAG: preprotein translocase subunit SecE [bacterium]|nr:preprotein translocase subunit SecE [bacterium]
MLNFFYDSLETLKEVKKPTRKEVQSFALAVFGIVIVASILFFFLDLLFGNLYEQIFQSFGV